MRFLNETGEGVVRHFINKTTVAVLIEEGFEIPYPIAELVPVDVRANENNTKISEESAELPLEQHISVKKTVVREGIYLAVSPENFTQLSISDFNLTLLNHSDYALSYSLSAVRNSGTELIEEGSCPANSSILLETISRKKLDDYSTLRLEALFYKRSKFDSQPPLSELVKIKPAKLYKEQAFVENELLNFPALIIPVRYTGIELFFDDPEKRKLDLQQLYEEKQKKTNQPVSKPHQKNNPGLEMEIDLHIEELMDNYSGMSNAEIVLVQLRHFHQALDKAINEHFRTLVVIHGVGNGRLKQEVRKAMQQANLRYYDASYARYGFGATEVKLH